MLLHVLGGGGGIFTKLIRGWGVGDYSIPKRSQSVLDDLHLGDQNWDPGRGDYFIIILTRFPRAIIDSSYFPLTNRAAINLFPE